jgi:hypothetical protein
MSKIGNSRGHSPPGRRSDLRFAGIVSVGMIATVITVAVLLAPFLAWNGSPGPNARERSQTIRLSTPSAPATARTSAATFASDRPGHVASAPGSRLALTLPLGKPTTRRAAGVAPRLAERRGVSERESTTRPVQPVGQLVNPAADSDGDGLPDAWELRYGLNPNNAADAGQDSDGDGLDNLTELRTRTAPNGADSDGNGVADGDEDSDADGLRNAVELRTASDPSRADSNGDGINDALDDADGDGAANLAEQQAGTDPGSSNEVPPVAESEQPTPAVIEDDPGIVDDGGSGDDAPDPPAPEHPGEQGVTPPAPAPEHPSSPDDGGAQAPDNPAPAPTPAVVEAAPAAPAPIASEPVVAERVAPTAPAPAAETPAPVAATSAPAAEAPAPAPAAPVQTTPAPEPTASDHVWHADRGGHGSRFAD